MSVASEACTSIGMDMGSTGYLRAKLLKVFVFARSLKLAAAFELHQNPYHILECLETAQLRLLKVYRYPLGFYHVTRPSSLGIHCQVNFKISTHQGVDELKQFYF